MNDNSHPANRGPGEQVLVYGIEFFLNWPRITWGLMTRHSWQWAGVGWTIQWLWWAILAIIAINLAGWLGSRGLLW